MVYLPHPLQSSWMNTRSVRVSKGPSSLLSPNTSLNQLKSQYSIYSNTAANYSNCSLAPPTVSRKSSNLTKSKVLLKRKNVVLALVVRT